MKNLREKHYFDVIIAHPDVKWKRYPDFLRRDFQRKKI